jgi:hypothetical protein
VCALGPGHSVLPRANRQVRGVDVGGLQKGPEKCRRAEIADSMPPQTQKRVPAKRYRHAHPSLGRGLHNGPHSAAGLARGLLQGKHARMGQDGTGANHVGAYSVSTFPPPTNHHTSRSHFAQRMSTTAAGCGYRTSSHERPLQQDATCYLDKLPSWSLDRGTSTSPRSTA